MLYLRDFKGTERYKKVGYFIFTDAKGEAISHEDRFLSEITPVLLWENLKDGGAYIKLAIYDKIPKGYKLFKDAPKAPYGYEWVYNGKPRTNGRSLGLLKIETPKEIKYKYLEECNDFNNLNDYLVEKHLYEIEAILNAYCTHKIDLVIPRDKNEKIVWEGDWNVVINDENYKYTGNEILVLKWYEGFEDTGYLIQCFMEGDWYEKE